MNIWFYGMVRRVLWLFFRIMFRFQSFGLEHIPREGGCILVANHVSFLDPPLIGGAVRRPLRFIARNTLLRAGFLQWFFPRIGVITIDRDKGDIAALRKAIQIVQAGNMLCLFPEGTRSPNGELQPAKGGIGFLVSKCAVPVVPVYIQGTYEAWPKGAKRMRPGKIRLFFGSPILPEDIRRIGRGREAYEQIAALTMERIGALCPAIENSP